MSETLLFASENGVDKHIVKEVGSIELWRASQEGNDQVVDLLIKSGADIHNVNKNGLNALMFASHKGHDNVVDILIKGGADVNYAESNGLSALMFASLNGHHKVVEFLIKGGADVNHINTNMIDALMMASENGHEEVVDILIHGGADTHYIKEDGCDALMLASLNGHDNIVDILIKGGADVHHAERNGLSALMFASLNGHYKVVEFLIKGGADVKQVNTNMIDALMIAAQNGHDKVVDILIHGGADTHNVQDSGWNALMFASLNGYDKVVDILIKSGADVLYFEPNGLSALMFASQKGHHKVVDILIKGGADVKSVNKKGRSILMIASRVGHDKVVDILIKGGADVDYVETNGMSALMFASLYGHDKVVDILIKGGSNINSVNKNSINALMIAAQNGHDQIVAMLLQCGANIHNVTEDGWDALTIASQNGHSKIVEILIQGGANIHNTQDNGWDALMIASENGHDNVVDILIKRGADIHYVNKNNISALMIASTKGHGKVVKRLIISGADTNCAIKGGWNALLFASGNGLNEVVKTLIKGGADIHHVDKDGINALMCASENGHDMVVDMLLKGGAHVQHVSKHRWDALLFAAESGHDKIVKLLIQEGADIRNINFDGLDAFMIACRNGYEKIVELCLKSLNKVAHVQHNKSNLPTILSTERDNRLFLYTLYLIDAYLFAFENAHIHVINTFSLLNFKMVETETSPYMLHDISVLLKMALSQFGKCDQIQQLQVGDSIGPTRNDLKNCRKSIIIYFKMSSCVQDRQRPSFEELMAFVSDVMSEFSKMRVFDALHFFIYQRSLMKIYSAINEEDRLTFFSSLLQFNYAEKNVLYLKEQNLLEPTAPSFTLSISRDMLNLLICGSDASPEFAKTLATNDAVDIFTDIISLHDIKNNSQSRYVTMQVVAILHNIARKKVSTTLVSFERLKSTLKDMTLPFYVDSLVLKMLLSVIVGESDIIVTTSEEIKFAIEYIIKALEDPGERYEGMFISKLLQGISKFAKHAQARTEILPLLDTLKRLLRDEDLEQLEYTTECLKEMSKLKEVSQLIMTNTEFMEPLYTLNIRGNSDIVRHVNSILWTSGRSTGILPKKADKVVSDDFPKEFSIDTNILGQGAFGSVHRVIDTNRPDEQKFVAKKVYFENPEKMELCIDEAMILLKTKHRRIVQFHGFKRNNDSFFIFLEYLEHGTLAYFINRRGYLDENLTRHFTIQILEGVDYLHQNKILHRDIKGSNILMEDNMNIKLTDFGISKIADGNGVATIKGTVQYMAPEVIYTESGLTMSYTGRADIWSVGCTVVEMLTGKPPNSSLLPVQICFRSRNGDPQRYQVPENASDSLKSFLNRTFQRNPQRRPTADWLLKNDAFVIAEEIENITKDAKEIR